MIQCELSRTGCSDQCQHQAARVQVGDSWFNIEAY